MGKHPTHCILFSSPFVNFFRLGLSKGDPIAEQPSQPLPQSLPLLSLGMGWKLSHQIQVWIHSLGLNHTAPTSIRLLVTSSPLPLPSPSFFSFFSSPPHHSLLLSFPLLPHFPLFPFPLCIFSPLIFPLSSPFLPLPPLSSPPFSSPLLHSYPPPPLLYSTLSSPLLLSLSPQSLVNLILPVTSYNANKKPGQAQVLCQIAPSLQ